MYKKVTLMTLALVLEWLSVRDTTTLTKYPTANGTEASWALPGAPIAIEHNKNWISCSVGFPLVDSSGNRYFLTARQCFRASRDEIVVDSTEKGDMVYAVNSDGKPGKPIGWGYMHLRENNDSFYDVELVKLYPGASTGIGGSVNVLSGKPHDVVAGERVCMIGRKNLQDNCGKVSKIGVKIEYVGYTWYSRVNLAEYCGAKGDSGGAVYDHTGAVGIHVGFRRNKDSTCTAAFAPIMPVFNTFKVHIPTLRML